MPQCHPVPRQCDAARSQVRRPPLAPRRRPSGHIPARTSRSNVLTETPIYIAACCRVRKRAGGKGSPGSAVWASSRRTGLARCSDASDVRYSTPSTSGGAAARSADRHRPSRPLFADTAAILRACVCASSKESEALPLAPGGPQGKPLRGRRAGRRPCSPPASRSRASTG